MPQAKPIYPDLGREDPIIRGSSPEVTPLNRDVEAAQPPRRREVGCSTKRVENVFRACQILILVVCTTTFIYLVLVEKEERTIEKQVGAMASAQETSAIKTSAMLNRLISKESGPVKDQKISELCESKRCGLHCAHGRAHGFSSFLGNIVNKIPSVLSMIPGFGGQISKAATIALGLKNAIEGSPEYRENGASCARSLASYMGGKRKEKDGPLAIEYLTGELRAPRVRREATMVDDEDYDIGDSTNRQLIDELEHLFGMEDWAPEDDTEDEELELAALVSDIFKVAV
jgi:hypothetical protein